MVKEKRAVPTQTSVSSTVIKNQCIYCILNWIESHWKQVEQPHFIRKKDLQKYEYKILIIIEGLHEYIAINISHTQSHAEDKLPSLRGGKTAPTISFTICFQEEKIQITRIFYSHIQKPLICLSVRLFNRLLGWQFMQKEHLIILWKYSTFPNKTNLLEIHTKKFSRVNICIKVGGLYNFSFLWRH